MRKANPNIVLGGVLLLALCGLLWEWVGGAWGIVAAPAVQMHTLDGEHLDLSAQRGRPVLVNFWHTSCQTCMHEMPHLAALHQEFSARGLVVIGIAVSYDELERVKRLRAVRGIPYPLVFDVDNSLARAFGGVPATPVTFLIAPDGTVVRNQVGGMSKRTRAALRESIARMLTTG